MFKEVRILKEMKLGKGYHYLKLSEIVVWSGLARSDLAGIKAKIDSYLKKGLIRKSRKNFYLTEKGYREMLSCFG